MTNKRAILPTLFLILAFAPVLYPPISNAYHEKYPSAKLMFIHPGTRKPYLPTMVRLLHQKILNKAGLEPCRFEDLRHTVAVRMLNKEGDVKAMSAQLGHSSPVMTKLLYADFLPAKKENAPAADANEPTNAELQKAADTLGAALRV